MYFKINLKFLFLKIQSSFNFEIKTNSRVDQNELVNKFGIGRDQTILNFMLHRHKIDTKLLSYKYNMTCMPKKEIIGEDMLHADIGCVMHFNGLPDKEKSVPFWMEKTYKYLYGESND